MAESVVNRLLQSLVTLLGLTILVFLLLRLAPGDPARLLLPPGASSEQIANMRQVLKLDAPIYVQYWTWLSRAATGDLGESLRSRQPVTALVMERLPRTIQLAGIAMAVSTAIGLVLGLFSALRPGSIADYTVRILALVGFAMPSFWFAIMLILLCSVMWGILPTSGYGAPQNFVLPTLTLAANLIGIIASMVAATTSEVLREDYIRTARAKGLAERAVLMRHVLRNIFVALITLLGIQMGLLLGGAVIVEAVFAWPGLGSLTIAAVSQRDYPVVQAVALIAGIVFLTINLAVDVLYAVVDPRIRFA